MRKFDEVRQHGLGLMPAKRRETGNNVDSHQCEVDSENQFEAAPGDRQVRAAIKNVSRKCSDSELCEQKGRLSQV